MTIASVSSGTQSATVTTEHSLATSTTGKTYVLSVDLTNMVNGDELELRIYTKALTGSTKHLAYFATFAHVQTAPNVFSVPVPALFYCEASLKQTAGTSRNFDWNLLSLD
jgi:hypothetical protein